MLRSLYSGISGLKVHQQKMDVIGNNIANVNTYGFKSSRVTFKDVFYQTMTGSSDPTERTGGGNASQIGYGSTVGSIDVLHTRSGYAPSGRAMDVAIEGEGYLIAKDALGNEMYTRVGNLYFDADGYLVDANRNYICGYPIRGVESGNIEFETNNPVSGKGSSNGLSIDTGIVNGSRLNDWNIVVKKVDSADDAGITVDGKKIVISSEDGTDVQDWLQELQNATEPTFADPNNKTEEEMKAEALWKAKNSLPAGVDLSAITATTEGTFSLDRTITLTITGGVSAETGKPLLDVTAGAQRIKKPNTLIDSDENGYYDGTGAGIAELTNIAIGSDGIISGTTPEGKIIPIGQLCLASVPNPEALVLQGNSYYKAVNNTGEIRIEAAGEGAGGSIVAGNLEMSNVDLSTEFADMITTQRGFQANSRIITVGDSMLEELVNMKR